ncbi:hypothetical protein AXX12_01180 [Anaerosporomusa subterranea]|uniref:Clostripain family protease n=1 Tax=Anaerosporomusa subterranea TaxID=1794912 RepID=A0A154BW67_ANASB|nr:clostripain-related cysteine peptidase [Anaerosporomusa subterranea]KYZ78186.1 hypothetical protein AXX12_01180 [Anaerosporomusa subterranea]
MNLSSLKKWAVLFYANGNNELEPEMRFAMNEIAMTGEARNLHVVLQIGREDYELARIIRGETQPPEPHEEWEGVRRYSLLGNQLILHDELGKINMAHPASLSDFLAWAFESFPAEKYMIIVGGHSWQYLGTMTDYSQLAPYIMGIPGLVEAVNSASNRAGVEVDLILFDTCNFNVIEVVYELGVDPCHAVKNMATYLGQGPIQGLSPRTIIQQADKFSHLDDIEAFIKSFIKGLGSRLVACQISHSQLSCIKELYNKLAIEYVSLKHNSINFQELLHGNPQDLWYGTLMDLREKLCSLIILASNQIQGQGIINVASQRTTNIESIKLYSMISFAKDNYWTHLLSEQDIREIEPVLKARALFEPIRISEREICRYISLFNPSFSQERIRKVFVDITKLQNWNLNG